MNTCSSERERRKQEYTLGWVETLRTILGYHDTFFFGFSEHSYTPHRNCQLEPTWALIPPLVQIYAFVDIASRLTEL